MFALMVPIKDAELSFKQAIIDKITQEMAVLKRLKFAANPLTRTPPGGLPLFGMG